METVVGTIDSSTMVLVGIYDVDACEVMGELFSELEFGWGKVFGPPGLCPLDIGGGGGGGGGGYEDAI